MFKKINYLFKQNESVSKKQKEKDFRGSELIYDNFELLLNNSDRILDNERYFYCMSKLFNLNLAYIGSWDLYLGILILLWKEKKLIESCSKCKGNFYIIGIGGSPLSGSNKCWGFCMNCKKSISISSNKFYQHYHSIMEKLESYSTNGAIIVKSSSEPNVSEIIRKKSDNRKIVKVGIDIETLINELKGKHLN